MQRLCTRCRRPFTPRDLVRTHSKGLEADRKAAGLSGVRFLYYACPDCGTGDVFIDILPAAGESQEVIRTRRSETEAAAQRLLEAHPGGAETSAGTTVCIRGRRQPRATDVAPRTASILVIDDDPQVRDFLVYVLTLGGHTVRVATNGVEGVRLYREHRPELVICDLYMPERDGLETFRELRQLDPGARVVVITANTNLLPVARALGATSTLAKPISRDSLNFCVNEVLARPIA